MKQRRIKFYSLDYLTYVNEVRIQEEEQIEMGWMGGAGKSFYVRNKSQILGDKRNRADCEH